MGRFNGRQLTAMMLLFFAVIALVVAIVAGMITKSAHDDVLRYEQMVEEDKGTTKYEEQKQHGIDLWNAKDKYESDFRIFMSLCALCLALFVWAGIQFYRGAKEPREPEKKDKDGGYLKPTANDPYSAQYNDYSNQNLYKK